MSDSGASTVHPRPREVHHVPSPAHTSPEPTRQLPADCVELFARALHADGAKADKDGKLPLPKWVHLTPAGDEGHELAAKGERVVRGRDGREFAIGDIERVLAGTELPMQFDWDHESVMGGFFGPSSTKAAGWIDKIVYLEEGDDERPEPGFWGRVERWTPAGQSDVELAYYRGLSPVVRYEYREPASSDAPAPPPLLVGFVNVALTNRPNLKMTLLNSQGQSAAPSAEDQTMHASLLAIAKSLGLPEGATPEQLAHAIATQLVPVSQLHEVSAKLAEATKQLDEQKRAAHAKRVDDLLDRAVRERRIPPSTKDFHRAACEAMGVEAYETHLAKLAPQLQDDPATDESHAAETSADVLTAEEKDMAHRMGVTEAEYAAAKKGGL